MHTYGFPVFEYFRRQALRQGLPMDASLIDFEELDAIEHTRKVCLNCKNTGPAQYGRKYHCNQCGREWKTIEGLRDDPETHRCTLENGASLVWADYTELWIDTVTGETHAPRQE
jgi:hypothetical protein